MPVTRLRTRRDAGRQLGLEEALRVLQGVAGAEELVALAERKLAAARGWTFIMVEPGLYADVVEHLTKHSRRPHKAVVLFTRLFSYLPPDGNEVTVDRAELARVVGITPKHVSEIMGELEAVGAVYRRREGSEALRATRKLFAFSIFYLFALFATLLLEVVVRAIAPLVW